tara:strand:+ start:1656 stop:2015 length:360 start_codon:yes stop_codon:yes gene_type:complete
MKKKPKKKPVGRPKKKLRFTDADLEKLATMQCTREEIAAFVGCSVSTLKRNFDPPIKRGWDRGKISLRRVMFDKAIRGNTTMMIWLSKNYLGMKDKVESSEEKEPLPWTYEMEENNGEQ